MLSGIVCVDFDTRPVCLTRKRLHLQSWCNRCMVLPPFLFLGAPMRHGLLTHGADSTESPRAWQFSLGCSLTLRNAGRREKRWAGFSEHGPCSIPIPCAERPGHQDQRMRLDTSHFALWGFVGQGEASTDQRSVATALCRRATLLTPRWARGPVLPGPSVAEAYGFPASCRGRFSMA